MGRVEAYIINVHKIRCISVVARSVAVTNEAFSAVSSARSTASSLYLPNVMLPWIMCPTSFGFAAAEVFLF